ncbi:MAG: hypothetical protein AAGB06_01755 [Verrucomicrobiota bacterium]
MKITTVASIIALALISLFSTGCFSEQTSAYKTPSSSTFLGIIEYEEATFSPTPPNTFAIRTDELVSRDNYSGDRIKLLWGLITIED